VRKVCHRHAEDWAKQEVTDYLELIARVTSYIPDKGQRMVHYYGLYAHAHRGKVKKANLVPLALRMVEEEIKPIPSKGWAEMIRKVYEVDPMLCPKCGGTMKGVAFLTDFVFVAIRTAPVKTAAVCPDGGREGRGVTLAGILKMRGGLVPFPFRTRTLSSPAPVVSPGQRRERQRE
jgi:hypothetical protein